MWKSKVYHLISDSPLIQHNGQQADPTHPLTQQSKKISGKRNKTLADHEELGRLSFVGSLYVDETLGIILPAQVLEAAIINGAKKFKEGPIAKSGMYVPEHSKLIYDGPDTVDELWEDKTFVFKSIVVVQRARILRVRPIFNSWEADVNVSYQDDIVNEEQVDKWVEIAGEQVGLCDWRPRYGRFNLG